MESKEPEEILNEWDRKKAFSKYYREIAVMAMKEYASLLLKEKDEEIERLKADTEKFVEFCLPYYDEGLLIYQGRGVITIKEVHDHFKNQTQ